MKKEVIKIVPYDPHWVQIYEDESASIKRALGDNCVAIHHIGSTSVPGLCAKATVDILAAVKDFSKVSVSGLEKLGFKNRGEVISSGRYFSKKAPGIHLHLFEEGNSLIERDLLFRDWLRSYPDDRDAYSKQKKELAGKHTDGMSYCNAKTEFIDSIVDKAKKHSENP